ncbi:MAG: hypothetical protein U0401_32905 [Anaerolineae bacterium]
MRLRYICSFLFLMAILLACGSEIYSLPKSTPGQSPATLSPPIPTNTSLPTPTITNTPLPTPTVTNTPSPTPIEGHIAFRSNRNKTWDIFAVNSDGSNLVDMSNHSGKNWDFTWSSDGKRLAFISSRNDSDPVECNMWCTTEIYTINADGTGLKRLTNVSAMNRSPAWSPDGTRIAFGSSRDEGNPSGCPFNCNFEIYVMNADGSDQRRLTNNPQVDNWPVWSPDGTRIAFTSYRDGNAEIYIMNADGSNPTRLTNNPASDFWPMWSPDGTRIAFVTDRNHPDTQCIFEQCQYDIYVMPVPTKQSEIIAEKNLIQLHRTNRLFCHPTFSCWSPDRHKVVLIC